MRRSREALVLALFALTACGGGSKVKVSDEPPGENCPSGGVRLEASGEVFYACDADQTTTERVAFGEPGNPCFGPALRVTTQVPGAEPAVVYVCEQVTPDPDSVIVRASIAQLGSNLIPHEVQCSCEETPESRASCLTNYEFFADVAPVIASCIANAEALTPVPRPAVSTPAYECIVTRAAALTACLDAIPGSECTAGTETAITACEDAPENDVNGCFDLLTGTPAELEQQEAWQEAFTGVIRLLRCPLVSDML